jgi:autotransporter-associated beta strand protein
MKGWSLSLSAGFVTLISAIPAICPTVALAGITFNSGSSTLTLKHDPDITNAGDTPLVKNPSTVPPASLIYPTAATYQISKTFTSGAASTTSAASLGHVTNATTASFNLATGTGITQTDPGNAVYPGSSSLLLSPNLVWDVTTGGFGPLATGYASITIGFTVGTGGSFEFHSNLAFLDQSNNPLRSPWVDNEVFNVPGTYVRTFTSCAALGSGTIASGKQIKMSGTLEFRANNANSPSDATIINAEVGGAPPTGTFIAKDNGSWFNPNNWDQTGQPNPLLLVVPNGPGVRARFLNNISADRNIDIDGTITVGTLVLDSDHRYTFSGLGALEFNTQAGNAVIDVRNLHGDGSHVIATPVHLSTNLDVVNESKGALILQGPINGAGGITKLGAGTLVLAGPATFSGGLTAAEGEVDITGPYAGSITLAGGTVATNFPQAGVPSLTAQNDTAGTLMVPAGASLLVHAFAIGANATLNKAGGGLLIVDKQQQHALASTLNILGGSVLFSTDAGGGQQPNLAVNVQQGGQFAMNSSQHLAALSLQGGSALLNPGGQKVLVLSSLNVAAAAGSKLDLGDNDLVFHAALGAREAALNALTAHLALGRANGTWLGPGIASSVAAANVKRITGLAIAINERLPGAAFYSLFDGEPVDTNSVLVKFTYNGDADLNGKIDADDYFQIDSGFVKHLTGYRNGDFDYNGKIDADDYFLIDSAFLNQNGVVLGVSEVSSAQGVPEPGLLAFFAIGAISVLRRYRRPVYANQ